MRMTAQQSPAGNRVLVSAAGLSLMAAVMLTGCATPPDQYTHFLRANEQVVAGGEYRIAPPDAIRINCPVAPEIDGAVRRIRPDGKISVRLLGEIQVAGLTSQEIADQLKRLLERYYLDPQVVVDVAEYRSKHFYVFGEVGAPGARRYTGRDTLVKALADARPNTFAWTSQIKLTRPGPNAVERATVVINLDEILASGRDDQDILLQPGDIIEVPPTPIAWVGHQVRALLYPVSPVLEAYETPADFLDANDTYNDRNRDDSGGSLGRRLIP